MPAPRPHLWLRLALALATGLGLLLVAAFASSGFGRSFGGHLDGERLTRAQAWPRFVEGAFTNTLETSNMAPGQESEGLVRYFTGDEVRVAPWMPTVPRRASDFPAPPADGLEITWIGHSTTLVDLDGHRIMTDPMLSHRASPIPWLGPSRTHPLPLPLTELPPVEVVVVSHDHYDHLDMATVEALSAGGTLFVVPLGIGAHLEAWDVPLAQIVELTWGQSHRLGDLTIHCVEARHYAGRGLFDQDEALWAGWVLEGPRHRLYYSGDTGWSEHFAQIGASLGPFDATLIKIGEYDVTWPYIHINPEEAVRAHLAARGGLLVPVHWGTFNLAYHPWNEPISRMVSAADAAGVRWAAPKPGERVTLGEPPPTDPWWTRPGP